MNHITAPLQSFETIDAKIDNLLFLGKLTDTTNEFFILAKVTTPLDLDQALQIAINWREVTKQFLFTVIIGLGNLAKVSGKHKNPPQHMIKVLQSGMGIISDDLCNVFATLKEAAPRGPNGAHYKWWEDSVVNVLLELTKNPTPLPILPGIQQLLNCMNKLAEDHFGAAVQLRIVEAIAKDVALAFKPLYSTLEIDGRKVFPETRDLAWINAHIKAEIAHHQQVKHEHCGMAYIANTPDEQQKLLSLIDEYISCWHNALSEFDTILRKTC